MRNYKDPLENPEGGYKKEYLTVKMHHTEFCTRKGVHTVRASYEQSYTSSRMRHFLESKEEFLQQRILQSQHILQDHNLRHPTTGTASQIIFYRIFDKCITFQLYIASIRVWRAR